MHKHTRWQARTGAARKPPTDKNIGHDIYRTEKQILLRLPAVWQMTCHCHWEHNTEPFSTSGRWSWNRNYHRQNQGDRSASRSVCAWTWLNCNDQREPVNNPEYFQMCQQAYCLSLEGGQKNPIDVYLFLTNLLFCFSSPTKSGYLSYRERSGIESEKGQQSILSKASKHSLQITVLVLRPSISLPGRVRNDHLRQHCSRQPPLRALQQDKDFFSIAMKCTP